MGAEDRQMKMSLVACGRSFITFWVRRKSTEGVMQRNKLVRFLFQDHFEDLMRIDRAGEQGNPLKELCREQAVTDSHPKERSSTYTPVAYLL